jgi:DNA-binding MarR family transcriptional regulator
VDKEMSVGTLAAFIRVARRIPALAAGALSLRAVAEEMGVGYSSLLRQTDVLAAGAPSVRSLDLLEKVIRPDDRRSRDVVLTERGEALMKAISSCMAAPLSQPKMAQLDVPPPASDKNSTTIMPKPQPKRPKD